MPRQRKKVFDDGRPAPNPAASDQAKSAAFLGALNAMGVKPNGTGRGRVKDPEWNADITQLVARSTPHQIFDSDGAPVIVSVKLDTINIEVDDEGEVVAWLYEES